MYTVQVDIIIYIPTAQSWLGASPDAIVTMANGEKVLVEIKCPYTARDLTVNEATDKIKVSAWQEWIHW